MSIPNLQPCFNFQLLQLDSHSELPLHRDHSIIGITLSAKLNPYISSLFHQRIAHMANALSPWSYLAQPLILLKSPLLPFAWLPFSTLASSFESCDGLNERIPGFALWRKCVLCASRKFPRPGWGCIGPIGISGDASRAAGFGNHPGCMPRHCR